MTTFTPSAWKSAGRAMEQASEKLYDAAFPAIVAQPLTTVTNSPLERAAAAGDALCCGPWYDLIAHAKEGLTSTGSKMEATGSDYAATEEAAANTRFWA